MPIAIFVKTNGKLSGVDVLDNVAVQSVAFHDQNQKKQSLPGESVDVNDESFVRTLGTEDIEDGFDSGDAIELFKDRQGNVFDDW